MPACSLRARRRTRAGKRLRGAIYARFSTKDQHSIEDQVRSCREFADVNGIDIADEMIFSDSSVRGCRTRRPGFTSLRAKLAQGVIDVVLIFSTNRLYRKTYKSLQFVEEEIVDRGIRCVFVRSGIDTADTDRWRQLLHLHAMMDEMVVHMGASHIRAAHEGMLDHELVHGTVTFGYQGIPVSGQKTKKNNARRRFEIDPIQADWVRQIFAWYVDDGLSISAISRKLNHEKAPLPPKCTTGQWTHQAVRLLLGNQRYDGFWAYGATKAQYLNKQDYVRQVPRDEPLRTKQIERLRIVDHVLWLRTQER
ncbi:MAG: recombinase family protein, partial [Planctomycetes bacterium]|nr:recombinase family protein [Planctomycetota bacterium]